MKRTEPRLILFWIILIPAILWAEEKQDNIFGKVAFVEGKVEIIRNMRKNRLRIGDTVYYKDIVQTSATSRVKVRNGANNEILFSQSTRVIISKNTKDKNSTLLDLKSGKVRCRLKEISKYGGYFKIKTPVAVTGVRGTDVIMSYVP